MHRGRPGRGGPAYEGPRSAGAHAWTKLQKRTLFHLVSAFLTWRSYSVCGRAPCSRRASAAGAAAGRSIRRDGKQLVSLTVLGRVGPRSQGTGRRRGTTAPGSSGADAKGSTARASHGQQRPRPRPPTARGKCTLWVLVDGEVWHGTGPGLTPRATSGRDLGRHMRAQEGRGHPLPSTARLKRTVQGAC